MTEGGGNGGRRWGAGLSVGVAAGVMGGLASGLAGAFLRAVAADDADDAAPMPRGGAGADGAGRVDKAAPALGAGPVGRERQLDALGVGGERHLRTSLSERCGAIIEREFCACQAASLWLLWGAVRGGGGGEVVVWLRLERRNPDSDCQRRGVSGALRMSVGGWLGPLALRTELGLGPRSNRGRRTGARATDGGGGDGRGRGRRMGTGATDGAGAAAGAAAGPGVTGRGRGEVVVWLRLERRNPNSDCQRRGVSGALRMSVGGWLGPLALRTELGLGPRSNRGRRTGARATDGGGGDGWGRGRRTGVGATDGGGDDGRGRGVEWGQGRDGQEQGRRGERE